MGLCSCIPLCCISHTAVLYINLNLLQKEGVKEIEEKTAVTASWCINVSNERGEVLVSVLLS